MQLGSRPSAPLAASDLAAATAQAGARFGHRPAVTVLRPGRREEQGHASLAQWAAKGAHLLEADLLVEPGDEVALLGPAGWLPVAVALAAWWSGACVTADARTASVVVAHEDVVVPPGDAEVLRWGDAADGAPLADLPEEPWSQAVQAFPDAPPPPRASPGLAALRVGGVTATHAEVIARVAADAVARPGPLGLAVDDDPDVARRLDDLAVRPLLTGTATVVLGPGVDRAHAVAERVATWR